MTPAWPTVALVTLLLAPESVGAQWLPTETMGVAVAASVGRVRLEGTDGSRPPGGTPGVWSVRVSLPVYQFISIDGEFSRSGVVEGTWTRSVDTRFREQRRDEIWAAYIRARLWRGGVIEVHPVVGAGVVRPVMEISGSFYNPVVGRWSDWSPVTDNYPEFRHTWTFSWGTDVRIGSQHVAVVPEFRVHEHFGDLSPWIVAQPRRTVRGSVGITYRF